MEVGAPRETDKVESLRYAPFFFVRANPAKGLILLQKYLPGADLDHKRKELTFLSKPTQKGPKCVRYDQENPHISHGKGQQAQHLLIKALDSSQASPLLNNGNFEYLR